MATTQELRHASVRALTGTASDYNSDFLSLFALSGITTGTFNERFLSWINTVLGTSYTNLPGAMQAYAVAQGANNWSSLDTIVAISPPVLTWDDANQLLIIDFDENAVVVGAVVTIEFYSDVGLTTLVDTATDTLDGTEILAGLISMVAGLANGTYYARGKITGSAFGATETVTIDSGFTPTFYFLGF